jgi:hypothetical protein
MNENQVQPPWKELASLGEVIQLQPKFSKEMVEGLEYLTKCLDELKTRDHRDCSQDGEVKLCFVDATMSGVKVATSVDTRATHSFISEWTDTSLHCKSEGSLVAIKVFNSTVKSVTGVVHFAPLRVRSWFGT